jgi:hypothetical protein
MALRKTHQEAFTVSPRPHPAVTVSIIYIRSSRRVSGLQDYLLHP